jgi:GNAT superfamily N-acetyltransferase
MRLTFHPLTPERWEDLVDLFGPNGACAGCWCMWWRLPRSKFNEQKGNRNKSALQRLVQASTMPGILAYDRDAAVGWCAVEPRENYPALAKSRTLAPVDDHPVWAITCLFIAKNYRKQGVSVQLIKAATRYVKSQGGHIVEGYPTDSKSKQADAWLWTGVMSAFEQAGFQEVARRSRTRPVVRKILKKVSSKYK